MNVNFPIPIASSPGRGINFSFPIVNDSLLWKKSGTTWTPVVDAAGNPTWGWKTALPAGTTRYIHFTETCDSPPPIQSSPHYNGFSYTDPAGTVHKFDVDFYAVATICGFPTGPRTGYATDNSGYYLDATSLAAIKVTTSNGHVITGTNWTDSNGNFFSATVVNSSETDWKDSAGHTALKIINNATNIQYQFPDTAGVYQTATLKLTSTNIKTNFACSGVVEYTGTANLPTELDLSNGQKYLFTYEATPNQAGYYTGRIKRVTLPTGGYVEHQYNGTNDSINCTDASVTNLSVLVSNGVTTSTWQLTRAANGSNWNTTVTAPLLPYDSAANQSVYTFNSAGQEITAKLYQGPATGTPLRTVNTTWTGVTPATQITILEDNQTQNETETSFDGYGNLTLLKEHDWGTGTPGSVLRTTTTTFLNTSGYIAANIVNRPTRVTVADGGGTVRSRTDIAYDESTYINTSCPTGVTQHNDAAYGCAFATRGNPTTSTVYADPVSLTGPIAKHRYYDFFGNLVKADLDCCQQKQWNYTATTNYAFPDSVVSGITTPQLTVSATYNSYTGLVATSTDENGKQTAYDYTDPGHLNRLVKITRPDNAQILYAYDDVNFTQQITSPVNGGDVVRQKTYADGLGRAVKQQLLDVSNTSYSITETQFDTWGRAYKVSNPHNNTAQYWTETNFDALGRVKKSLLPDNSQNVASYTLNTVITTDPAGKQRKSVSDGLGRLTSVYEPDVTTGNSLTAQTSYAYTTLNALATVTQGVQTRTFLYDGLSRITDSTTPEAGHFQYQYNNFNLLTQRTDARGVITTYAYDTLNRLATVTYNVGATGVASPGNVTLTYGTISAQNNNGRLITLADGVGSENYTYDNLGRPTQLQKIINTTTYTTQYAYNLASELTSITYPSNRVVQQSFDAMGRLCAIGASGSTCSTGTTYAAGFNYNPAFEVTSFNYGNGVAATFGFSPDRLQLSSLSYVKNSSTLFGLNYSYGSAGSNNGQIAGITDNVDNGRSATYGYDALYRLTSAVTTGSAGFPKWGLSMTFDRYGNRSAETVTAGTGVPSNSVTIDATKNRISGSPYAYDSNGNMTNDGANTLTYDAEDQTVSASNGSTSGTYTYDGNGLRVKKVSGGTTTVYVFSGSQVVAEYDNGAAVGSPSREYVYSGPQRVATIIGGIPTYQHNDLISARVLTDSSGNVVGQRGHFPYGETWYETGTTTKMKFTSYERDPESGNDFAMARYDVNRLGRFSASDPIPGSIVDPQSLNRYIYVRNDSISLVDPTGTCLDQSVIAEGGRARGQVEIASVDPYSLVLGNDFLNDADPQVSICGGGRGGAGGAGWGGGGGTPGCSLEGLYIPCSLINTLLGMGSAAQCPNNTCSGFNSKGDFVQFIAGAGGAAGYVTDQQRAAGLNEVNGLFLSNTQYGQYVMNTYSNQLGSQLNAVAALLNVDPKTLSFNGFLQGGNYNFKIAQSISDLYILNNSCYTNGDSTRCDSGLHFHDGSNPFVHLDTAYPFGSFSGFFQHTFVDVIWGNLTPVIHR